jgi:hypothetical protein
MNESELLWMRTFKGRIIFSWLFIILLFFFLNNSLLSQLQQPPFIYPDSDNTYWALHLLGIPQWLLQHYYPAIGFDIVLTCACIICIIVPQQRLFTWITVIGVWILYISFGSAAGKHYAQIGYIIIPIAFLAQQPKKFDLLWSLVRYWICFLYFSAGLYKIYYGGFFGSDNMSNILQQVNANWFYFHPEGFQSSVIRFLIDHPSFSQWFYRLTVCIDLILIIGWFTKKYDWLLLFVLVLFHVSNLFFNHISFVEQSLIFAPFLPWEKWAIAFKQQ